VSSRRAPLTGARRGLACAIMSKTSRRQPPKKAG